MEKNVFKTAFSCYIFSQKNSTINIWRGSKCVSLLHNLDTNLNLTLKYLVSIERSQIPE